MFKHFIIFTLAFFALVEAAQDDADWARWKNQRGRSYRNTSEEVKRKSLWAKSKSIVEAHNSNPRRGFTMELNEFADMDDSERAMKLGARLPVSEKLSREKRQIRRTTTRRTTTTKAATTTKPTTTRQITTQATTTRPSGTFNGDWRTYAGKVTPIKNQGQCGSCWAFATIGVLESRYAIAKNVAASNYSEQHLVDCSRSTYYNYGCDGGWPNNALIYVRDVAGVNLASAYPYTGVQASTCQMKAARYAATASTAFTRVTASESAIIAALASGPLIAAIDVQSSFDFYKSGVYYSTSCSSDGSSINHAVIIVGYGTDAINGKYWIVRNSWGTGWGESGYIRMARGPNTCNIMSYVSYPNLV